MQNEHTRNPEKDGRKLLAKKIGEAMEV